MGTGVLQNVLLFLADTLLSLYALVFLLRFLLGWAQVDFYNPVFQSLVRLTQPLRDILVAVVPPLGNIDLTSFVLACLLKILSLFLIGQIQGMSLAFEAVFVLGMFKVAEAIIFIYIFSLILLSISSWFMSGGQILGHPLVSLLYVLNAPILSRIQRFLPTSGALDFSPLVALIGLYLLQIILRTLYEGRGFF